MTDATRVGAGQPHAAHPGGILKFHPIDRFGCVTCHGGEGQAKTARTAHASGPHGRSFATGHAVELACARCHVNERSLSGAPFLSDGRELIQRLGCAGCHNIRGFKASTLYAPDLHGLADRTTGRWIFAWMKNPRRYAENARMPRYELEEPMLDALVGYLMTFSEEKVESPPAPPAGDADQGRRLFRTSFCIACHSVDGRGANEAIDLARVGSKLNARAIERLLMDTHAAAPGSPMPQYRFTARQVADLTSYSLEELGDPTFLDPEGDPTLARVGGFWADENERIDRGRRLFKELRCANCHAFPGAVPPAPHLGPDLARLDDSALERAEYKDPEQKPATLEDYVWRKVQSPRAFEPLPFRYKMPTYDLQPEQALHIAVAIMAQIDAPDVPESMVVRDPADDPLHFNGEFGELVGRYRCYSCHSFKGIGHNTTYDLGLEGSRVQRDWLVKYLKLPYTIRPLLPLRMPIFHLTDHEVEVLADGLMRTQRDEGIDNDGEFEITGERVQAGRRLLHERGCLACHQMGSTGGYLGPSFTDGSPVGRKLKPGWIVRWLSDPSAMTAGVLEQRQAFTLEQKRALASYLVSIRSANGEGG
ncbi:MAG: c-type cytochrome [Acidobacteriota bacterium]